MNDVDVVEQVEQPEKTYEDHKREHAFVKTRDEQTSVEDWLRQRRAELDAKDRGEEPPPPPESTEEAEPEPEAQREPTDVEIWDEQVRSGARRVDEIDSELTRLERKAEMASDPQALSKYGDKLTADEYLQLRNAQEAGPEAVRLLQLAWDSEYQSRLAERNATFSEMNFWQSRIGMASPQAQPAPQSNHYDVSQGPPSIDSFDGTAAEYEQAIKDWAQNQQQAARASAEAEIENRLMLKEHEARLAEARQKHSDFDKVMQQGMATLTRGFETDPQVKMTALVLDYLAPTIQALPNSADVVFALFKDFGQVQKLGGMSEKRANAELVRLSATLQNVGPARKSAAPRPPSPVATRSSERAFDSNDEGLSPEEWARQRNEALRKRHQAR